MNHAEFWHFNALETITDILDLFNLHFSFMKSSATALENSALIAFFVAISTIFFLVTFILMETVIFKKKKEISNFWLSLIPTLITHFMAFFYTFYVDLLFPLLLLIVTRVLICSNSQFESIESEGCYSGIKFWASFVLAGFTVLILFVHLVICLLFFEDANPFSKNSVSGKYFISYILGTISKVICILFIASDPGNSVYLLPVSLVLILYLIKMWVKITNVTFYKPEL